MDKPYLFPAGCEETRCKVGLADKSSCHIVSAAVGGIIRHSMESAGGFRQQCYELLQVTSTKDAEIELERRLMNIIHKAVKTVQDAKHSEETNTYELWLDRSSLSWDSVTKEQDSDTADRRLVHAGDRA